MEAGKKLNALFDERVKSGKPLDELLADGGNCVSCTSALPSARWKRKWRRTWVMAYMKPCGRGGGNSRNGKSKKKDVDQ